MSGVFELQQRSSQWIQCLHICCCWISTWAYYLWSCAQHLHMIGGLILTNYSTKIQCLQKINAVDTVQTNIIWLRTVINEQTGVKCLWVKTYDLHAGSLTVAAGGRMGRWCAAPLVARRLNYTPNIKRSLLVYLTGWSPSWVIWAELSIQKRSPSSSLLLWMGLWLKWTMPTPWTDPLISGLLCSEERGSPHKWVSLSLCYHRPPLSDVGLYGLLCYWPHLHQEKGRREGRRRQGRKGERKRGNGTIT